MAIGQLALNKKRISPEEKKRLVLILTELKSRGLPVPENLEIPETNAKGSWNLDINGYFVRNDGWTFKPRPVLEDFIKSRARFILIKAGRGGGKTVGGAQKPLS